MIERVHTAHDNPRVAADKMFNMIQAARTDIACMSGSIGSFTVDNDTIKAAKALVREMEELNAKKGVTVA